MTEGEWLTSDDPILLLLEAKGAMGSRSVRKSILASVSMSRRLDDLLGDLDFHHGLVLAERHADGMADETEVARVTKRNGDSDAEVCDRLLVDVIKPIPPRVSKSVCKLYVFFTVPDSERCRNEDGEVVPFSYSPAGEEIARVLRSQLTVEHCHIIRDIFGNPFRPVAVDPSWLTSTVTALARGIYDDRAFDRLPILADALQDAGCDHLDILAHCRGDGPHVRGCWVVDLLLGKS